MKFRYAAAVLSAFTLASPIAGYAEENARGEVATTEKHASASDIGQSIGASDRRNLTEIVVTARKTEEHLLDVPAPVSVIGADELANSGLLLIRDYASTVPGFSITTQANGFQFLSIRGLASEGTTTVLIDDVPLPSGTPGAFVPDLDPADLAHVEVLRGPQGTLYGANSMGGLLKYVTTEPSTQGYSGHVAAGISAVHNGNTVGYNFRGGVNIPVNETLAFRVSGFDREDPGYIDNPLLHHEGVNKTKVYGGRLAALWEPMDAITLKVTALYQDSKSDGTSEVTVAPGFGDLQQGGIAGIGGEDRSLQAYSATLIAKLGGGITLTSVTGYDLATYQNSYDFTFALLGFVPGSGFPEHSRFPQKQVTEEVRLAGSLGPALDWLLGGYFSHQYCNCFQSIDQSDPATGTFIQRLGTFGEGGGQNDRAVFGTLTYRISDRLDVQIGGREEWSRVFSDEGIDTGIFAGTIPPVSGSSSAFTYLFTPRFRLSPNAMVYARLASGYRPGGGNSPVVVSFGAPAVQKPDKTENYELGIKADYLDHRLAIDSSVYYIKWKDVQTTGLIGPPGQAPIFGYNSNAGAAKSEGVELSMEAKPTSGLTIDGWVSYDEAVLTQPFPRNAALYGIAGDRLPHTSRWSGQISAQQNFPLPYNSIGFVAAATNYLSNQFGDFQAPTVPNIAPGRQYFPSYAKTELRTGVTRDLWKATLYVYNVADKRAPIAGGIGYFNPSQFVYITPRTIGLNISRDF